MPLHTQQTTSSHHFLHGMFWFDPSVYFQFWNIAGNYSRCEPANWGLLSKSFLKSDILKTHRRKHVGCWFSHHSSQFLSLSSNYSEETPCLDHLTRSSSHRPPWVLMPWLCNWLCNSTCLEKPLHSSSIVKTLFNSNVYFQCWDTPRKHIGCEPGNWGLPAKTVLSSFENKNVSFSHPPRKTLWMFEKSIFSADSSSLLSVLVTSSWIFWRNTVLESPY